MFWGNFLQFCKSHGSFKIVTKNDIISEITQTRGKTHTFHFIGLQPYLKHQIESSTLHTVFDSSLLNMTDSNIRMEAICFKCIWGGGGCERSVMSWRGLISGCCLSFSSDFVLL